MMGSKGGMVKQIERLVTMLLKDIATNLDDQAYYARETGGCPSQAYALASAAEAMRGVEVPHIMQRLMEPEEKPDEDQSQPD